MKIMNKIRLSVSALTNLILATGALLFLIFLGIIGITGIDFFRFIVNMNYEQHVSITPAMFSHGVNQVAFREGRSFWASLASGTLTVKDLEDPSLVLACWMIEPGNRQIRIITATQTCLLPLGENESWLKVLSAGSWTMSASASFAELGKSVSGKSFSRIEVNSTENLANLPPAIVETEVGSEPSMKRGILFRKETLYKRIIAKFLDMNRTDNRMALELLDMNETPLMVSKPGSKSAGTVEMKELGADSVLTSPELDGVLAGTKLRITYFKDFGKLFTPDFPFFSKAMLLGAAVLLAGTICFFYYQGKKTEDELILQNDWIANLAHTLRGPLHSLGVLTEAFPTASGDGQERLLELFRGELDIMDRTCKHFMRLARAGKNQIELNPSTVNPADVACGVCDRLVLRYPKFKRESITLEGMDNLSLNADPDAFREVLESAVENSLKFSPQGNPINIRGKVLDGKISIQICDQGLGILESDLNKIGERFFRGSQAGMDGIVGTGLGVYLAKMLCEKMNGEYTVTSAGPGKGACATIILPKA